MEKRRKRMPESGGKVQKRRKIAKRRKRMLESGDKVEKRRQWQW